MYINIKLYKKIYHKKIVYKIKKLDWIFIMKLHCGKPMFLEEKGQGSKKWKCKVCGYIYITYTDAFEPPVRLIDPTGIELSDLADQVQSGNIGLNQIPIPERDDVSQLILSSN